MNARVTLSLAALLFAAGCASDRTTSRSACSCIVPQGASTPVDAATADALTAALQDERRAQAFYRAVMARHGQVRPFSNIVNAEARHEEVVSKLMRRHDVPVPGADLTGLAAAPDTFAASCSLAAQLERDNIAMYDRLLPGIKEPDIRQAFENMRAASLNGHLPAFERWAAGTPAALGPVPGCCGQVCLAAR